MTFGVSELFVQSVQDSVTVTNGYGVRQTIDTLEKVNVNIYTYKDIPIVIPFGGGKWKWKVKVYKRVMVDSEVRYFRFDREVSRIITSQSF